jgi:uncharacterized protein
VLSAAVLGVAAFAISMLTLFTGFGLGTLLLPFFVFFLPVPVAVAATAVVHVLNNLFKLSLLYRDAEPRVILGFGVPAVLCAFAGALLLAALAGQEPWLRWQLGGRTLSVTPVAFLMGAVILGFAVLDLSPAAERLRVGPRWLPLGGAISGFFGGLSGHQGALRAAFLAPLGLAPAAFAATQTVLACLVDFARLAVYGAAFYAGTMTGLSTREEWQLVAVATVCAFAGAYVGRRLLPRVTIRGVRTLTGVLLVVVGAGLMSGLI